MSPQTLPLSTNQLSSIERRLDNLETILRRLLTVIEAKVADGDDFDNLFSSREFARYVKDARTRYQQSPDEFVNPFAILNKGINLTFYSTKKVKIVPLGSILTLTNYIPGTHTLTQN